MSEGKAPASPLASSIGPELMRDRDVRKLHYAASQALELMREEYWGLLCIACPVVDGEPQREAIDAESLDLAERYESVLTQLGAALGGNT